jgi:hypothetical protein
MSPARSAAASDGATLPGRLTRGAVEGAVAFFFVVLGVLVLAEVRSFLATGGFFSPLSLFPVFQQVYAVHIGYAPVPIDRLSTLLIALYLVPVVVLVAFGRSVTATGTPPVNATEAAGSGATVAVGYCLLIVFTSTAFAAVSPALTLLSAGTLRLIAVAGVAYPVIFGGLGGYLHYRRG